MNETQATHIQKRVLAFTLTITIVLLLIFKSYPVIREVFVDNLPHFSLLILQNVRRKKQNDVQHGCLGRQSCASMLRQRVS